MPCADLRWGVRPPDAELTQPCLHYTHSLVADIFLLQKEKDNTDKCPYLM